MCVCVCACLCFLCWKVLYFLVFCFRGPYCLFRACGGVCSDYGALWEWFWPFGVGNQSSCFWLKVLTAINGGQQNFVFLMPGVEDDNIRFARCVNVVSLYSWRGLLWFYAGHVYSISDKPGYDRWSWVLTWKGISGSLVLAKLVGIMISIFSRPHWFCKVNGVCHSCCDTWWLQFVIVLRFVTWLAKDWCPILHEHVLNYFFSLCIYYASFTWILYSSASARLPFTCWFWGTTLSACERRKCHKGRDCALRPCGNYENLRDWPLAE